MISEERINAGAEPIIKIENVRKTFDHGRVEALDGRLGVSSPPGAGTTIEAELPC